MFRSGEGDAFLTSSSWMCGDSLELRSIAAQFWKVLLLEVFSWELEGY
jgi:hypothetical protein